MHFTFDLEKTIQVVAELLRQSMNQQMSRLRLMKLLYIADRESLRDNGWPMTGDSFVAMAKGPVLDRFYFVVNGMDGRSPELDRHILQRDRQMSLLDDPGKGRLNRYEIKKLEELIRHYAEFDEADMIEETHKMQEWKKNAPSNTPRKKIPLEDVLAALDFDEEKIASVIKEADEMREMHEQFAKL